MLATVGQQKPWHGDVFLVVCRRTRNRGRWSATGSARTTMGSRRAFRRNNGSEFRGSSAKHGPTAIFNKSGKTSRKSTKSCDRCWRRAPTSPTCRPAGRRPAKGSSASDGAQVGTKHLLALELAAVTWRTGDPGPCHEPDRNADPARCILMALAQCGDRKSSIRLAAGQGGAPCWGRKCQSQTSTISLMTSSDRNRGNRPKLWPTSKEAIAAQLCARVTGSFCCLEGVIQ